MEKILENFTNISFCITELRKEDFSFKVASIFAHCDSTESILTPVFAPAVLDYPTKRVKA
jgi:hypothetical protein